MIAIRDNQNALAAEARLREGSVFLGARGLVLHQDALARHARRNQNVGGDACFTFAEVPDAASCHDPGRMATVV